MFKKIIIALLKTVIGLAVSAAIVVGSVYYIYNALAIDSQELLNEFEEINREKPLPTVVPAHGDEENTGDATPTPTPIPDWPTDIDITSWEFILANANNNISTYAPPTTKYFDGCLMDERITDAARTMIAEARAGGYSVVLSTGYQDYNTTTTIYNNAAGANRDVTTAEVAAPGTNEHQTGLAIDILSSTNAAKEVTAYEKSTIAGWLKRHCQEYGFILRYPEGKETITGVEYSPWHYRYVGVTAATYIMEKGLCLEEFLALYGVQNTSAAQPAADTVDATNAE